MIAFLLMLGLVVLFIGGGVTLSLRLYNAGAVKRGIHAVPTDQGVPVDMIAQDVMPQYARKVLLLLVCVLLTLSMGMAVLAHAIFH